MPKITDYVLSTERILWQGTGAKDTEYIITNQRVISYSSKKGKDPKIINLYEVNGQIQMKYNKSKGTGSIYIPSPQQNRYGIDQSRMIIMGRPIMSPDIKDIKEPYKAYNILIEAMQMGKRTHWK